MTTRVSAVLVAMTACAVLGPWATTASAQDAAPAATPAMTVTPNVDLVDLQAVTVAGTGLAPDEYYDLYQCPASGGMNNCEWGWDYVSTDAAGAFADHVFGVAAVIQDGRGDDVDCRDAPGACELRIYGRGSTALARVSLHFDPDAPRAGPATLTANPTTGLVDGQLINVSGAGLRPGGYLFMFVCQGTTTPDESVCPRSFSAGEDDRVDAAGNLTTQHRVRAVFAAHTSGSGKPGEPPEAGQQVDCRVSSCFLSAFEDPWNGSDVPIVPLEFDPDAPLAPLPDLTVEPSTDLVDGQAITITGTDWFPGEEVAVLQCTLTPADRVDTCARHWDFPVADADGAFTVERAVPRSFEDWNGGTTTCGTDDCGFYARRLGAVDRERSIVRITFETAPSPSGQTPLADPAAPAAVTPRFTG